MVEFKADLSAIERQPVDFFRIVIDISQQRRVIVNRDAFVM